MIPANGGLPAHRYTPQVTQRWPRGSEPASVLLRPGRWSGRLLKYVVYAAMTVRIRAFNHTLVGSNADSREEVMGSNPAAP